jgi:hypothetical protein
VGMRVLGGVVASELLVAGAVHVWCGWLWVCMCAWWCVEVGVVCIVDCGDVEVGAVNVVCFDVGGGVVVVSIVSGGSWGSCGAV